MHSARTLSSPRTGGQDNRTCPRGLCPTISDVLNCSPDFPWPATRCLDAAHSGRCHTLCPAPRLPCPDCHPRLPAQRRAGPPIPHRPVGEGRRAGARVVRGQARRGESRSWCFGRGRQSRLGGRGQAVSWGFKHDRRSSKGARDLVSA